MYTVKVRMIDGVRLEMGSHETPQRAEYLRNKITRSPCVDTAWIERENLPPFVISEPEYWRCPTHVLTGATWLAIGGMIGYIVSLIAG